MKMKTALIVIIALSTTALTPAFSQQTTNVGAPVGSYTVRPIARMAVKHLEKQQKTVYEKQPDSPKAKMIKIVLPTLKFLTRPFFIPVH